MTEPRSLTGPPGLAMLVIFATSVVAAAGPATSPYAGQPDSGIAALPPGEVTDLRHGAGMGLARAAELNHYPGPKHVLELAQPMQLTDAQQQEVEALRAEVLERASRLGERIVEEERELDLRFRAARIDDDALRRATAEIAALRGELRYVHLRAHLATTALLSPRQIAIYDRLRGYAEGPSSPSDCPHHEKKGHPELPGGQKQAGVAS